MVVGADNVITDWPGHHGGQGPKPVRLSVALDACKNYACVVGDTLVAAHAYRSRADGRQLWSDGASIVSAVGLAGVLIGTGHASLTTMRYWTAYGLLPIVSDDMAQFSAHARLYNIAATAMSELALRYNELDRAVRGVKQGQGAWEDSKTDLKSACASVQEARKTLGTLGPEDQAVFKDPLNALNARCELVTAAAAKLDAATSRWNTDEDAAQLGLAADAEYLDDTIARMDRNMRAAPAQALRGVLAMPFTLAGDVIAGTRSAGDYKGAAHDAFDRPYHFDLSIPDAAELPDATPDDLVAPEGPGQLLQALYGQQADESDLGPNPDEERIKKVSGIGDTIANVTPRLNSASQAANRRLAETQAVEDILDRPVLQVDFKADDRPVTFVRKD